MFRSVNRRLLVVALGLGLAAALGVYGYTSWIEATLATPERRGPVVVAQRDIPAQVELTQDMLAVREVPEDLILESSVTRLDEAVGGISQVELLEGEQLARSRIFRGEPEANFAYLVPEDMRAVAIGVDEVLAVGNLIRPGDHVDVLVTADDGEGRTRTMTLIQDLQLLAVGQVTDPNTEVETGGSFSTVTLAVDPEDAQLLTRAELEGLLKLSLRSPLDRRTFELESVGTVRPR